MNDKVHNSFISKKVSEEKLLKDACTTTDLDTPTNDGEASTRSTEDDINIQCTSKKIFSDIDNEPVFVIVDSKSLSNPSSKELLVETKRHDKDAILKDKFQKHIKQGVIPFDTPSTSKDFRFFVKEINCSESKDELQMADINLQSENEILLEDNDVDNESIVISYLRNRDTVTDKEEIVQSNRKRSSLLRSVPKMETILEGEQFCAFPISKKISQTSLDVHIPSYPGSPRSLHGLEGSEASILSDEESEDWKRAIEFIHRDHELLVAAETGNDQLIEVLIAKGTNIQQRDHLGRNALHLAVCAESMRAIVLLLRAGINPTVKDNLGMTPLSLCLMRRPSIKVANLLFAHGAVILPRATPNDTGLFLQFVMMCRPSTEERKILRLLVEKGAKVNDPEAPGGRQALHFAAMSNNCDLIRLLVDFGADLTLTNHRNETPTQVAKTFKCRDAYRLLTSIEDTLTENKDLYNRLCDTETDTTVSTSLESRSSDRLTLTKKNK
ncbi:nuclear factor NF-kappa-B p100 subunit-like [Amyelois transitella]|uniref:nuclear factor NF-kappa-B p100 subunit-like n=1 Tax=Amyelois transitella TaxID=680683 RepID=UPI00298F7BDB|nr:nuclear factor NF-kappa-B p100 subunit-like [Amyelois transitella]